VVAFAVVACACSKTDTAAAPGATIAGLPLRVVTDLPLPGGATRLDYQDLDPTARRLYVAHLGDSSIDVVDLDQLRVVTTINGVNSVHGVRVAPDRHRLYASAAGANQLDSIDTTTNQVVATAATGDYPDGIAYDPDANRVFVSNEQDTAESVIDASSGQRVDTIDLGGAAGNTAFDPTTKHILVNVQDRGHIAVIDPTTDRVIGTIDTPGCGSNHGLYVDASSQLAFDACEGNAKLLTIDLRTKQVTGTDDVGDTPDVLAWDPGLRRLYVASESGTVTILDENTTTLHEVAQAKLADAAHTVAVDPTTHRVYFALQEVDGRPTLRVMEPT
jgi:YVTN family beta-propeller protein